MILLDGFSSLNGLSDRVGSQVESLVPVILDPHSLVCHLDLLLSVPPDELGEELARKLIVKNVWHL